MIEVEHLVKKYGSLTAVDDLNMKIEPGRIYGLLGKNGAGKTTTMNMMTGYIGATSGTVKVCGHDIFKEAEAAKWLTKDQLDSVAWLPADVTLIEKIRRNMEN